MSAELERVSLKSRANSVGFGGRVLSVNVQRLHDALHVLLGDTEREQFAHCLSVYHAKRNVYDLVQTLRVILDNPSKRQLLPMLRLVLPRADQLLFDQYTSEGLYLKSEPPTTAVDSHRAPNVTSNSHTRSPSVHFAAAPVFSTACPGTVHPEVHVETRHVTLRRSKSHEGLGFSIRGGAEHGVGIYVSLVEPGSFAEREGLHMGDQIIRVNEVVFDRVTHADAVKVLKGCKKLCLTVCSMGRIPGSYVTNHVYTWVDPQGRSISPPSDLVDQHNVAGHHVDSQRHGHTRSPHQRAERRVTISLDDGRPLGLMIRGGAEYSLGIYIAGVDHGSAAECGGLKVGDQILEVNGKTFRIIAHDEAVQILKSSRRMLMTIRDVGRLPHSRAVVDETEWISSPQAAESSSHAALSVSGDAGTGNTGKSMCCKSLLVPSLASGFTAAQSSLEEQAYLLLTETERQTMSYYIKEYQRGHIGVEPFAMALFELFNTHAKLTLLAEVRALVAPQDLERFDGQVVHHEMEAWKMRQANLGLIQQSESISMSSPESHVLPVCQLNASATGYAKNECVIDGNVEAGPAGVFNSLPEIALNEVASKESSPICRPAPPSRHDSPKFQMKRPMSSLCQTHMFFTSPSRMHQEPNAYNHTNSPCSAHASPCTVYHSSSPCSAYPSPLCSDRHSPPCSHRRPGSLNAPPTKDLVQFLMSRQAAMMSPHLESPNLSRAATPTLTGSARSSPSLSPSLLMPAPPPSTPEKPKVMMSAPNTRPSTAQHHRLNPEQETREDKTLGQPRGATLSQLSDSGQTLSEDSGVDIAESGGLSNSPRPGKPVSHHAKGEMQGAGGQNQATNHQTGLLEPVLVRVFKSANTLGIAVEGGANTRQPLPRIATIQKGGSAHLSGQLRVGQVILEVNNVSLKGMEHRDAARLIAEAFKTKDKDYIDFLIADFNIAL